MQVRSILRLFLVCFLFPCSLFAQDNILELFPESEPVVIGSADSSFVSLFADAGCFMMPVNSIPVNGLSVKLGGTGIHFSSSFAFDFMSTDRVFFPSAFDVTRPGYTYVFFGWDYEYICNPEKRVSVSLHMKSGFGHAAYFNNDASGEIWYYEIEDSSSYYTPVYSYYSGLVASNHFFMLEPGINILCKLSPWLGVGAGFSSRVVFVMSEESPLRDEGYYVGNFFIRFRIPERRK